MYWLAAHVLTLFTPQEARRHLAYYARWACVLVLARALKRVRIVRLSWSKTKSTPRRLTVRRACGADLRRAPTPAEQARAIYTVLHEPERWITHLTRRIARRFTKLRNPPPALSNIVSAILAAPSRAASLFDSS